MYSRNLLSVKFGELGIIDKLVFMVTCIYSAKQQSCFWVVHLYITIFVCTVTQEH